MRFLRAQKYIFKSVMHYGCMNTKNLIPIAIAACSYSLPVISAGENEIILQLTPAGKFLPSDGREMNVPYWYIDQAVATKVIERFNARNQPVVIDYEHQTLHKEKNGQKAPAAAWIRELIWRDGEGLFARAELTGTASREIADKEYLYISPVFFYDKAGNVTQIEMAALTNTPAIHGMKELELRAAATFGYQHDDEEQPMNKLLTAIIAGLALQATATEDEAVAALNAHFAKDPLKGVRETLGLPATAGETELVAACTSLKTKSPDPAKFVSIDVMAGMKQEMAALTARQKERDAKDLDDSVKAALKDGRLLAAQESWARKLGESDLAALNSYLATAQPIAALTSSQTQGKPPVADEKTGLTEDELAVCANMGIAPEDFKKAKED